MQENFYIPGTDLYEGKPYSFLWPFSQTLAATISVSDIPGQPAGREVVYARELQDRLHGLDNYWGPPGLTLPGPHPTSEPPEAEPPEAESPEAEAAAPEPPEAEAAAEATESPETEYVTQSPFASFDASVVPPGGLSYYDDNEWVGIELVRLYKTHHEASLLERAEQIMQFVMAGWQTDPALACPGGVPFSDSPTNTDRNTVTDGPGAELALQLYRLTRNRTYLRFAQMAYEWVRSCLMQPNGLYADHIDSRGKVAKTEWSYNQGSMIGAGVMLYQATGNNAYLYQARQTAKAALAYYTMDRLLSELPFFVEVYFRNLMYLDSVTHDPPGRKLAQAYVDHMWVSRRPSNGLFVTGSSVSSSLLGQAAIVQIYALLSEPASRYF